MAWRLALSLVTLRSEVNSFAPNRSKVSDGTIGDPAHASRASRHNPNRHGVVTALDLTHDPAGGYDAHAHADRHREKQAAGVGHPELAYIVSDRRICSPTNNWAWRTYTGSNPHTHHVHWAVGVGPDSRPEPPYDSTQAWGVAPPPPPPPPAPEPPQEEDLLLTRWQCTDADAAFFGWATADGVAIEVEWCNHDADAVYGPHFKSRRDTAAWGFQNLAFVGDLDALNAAETRREWTEADFRLVVHAV